MVTGQLIVLYAYLLCYAPCRSQHFSGSTEAPYHSPDRRNVTTNLVNRSPAPRLVTSLIPDASTISSAPRSASLRFRLPQPAVWRSPRVQACAVLAFGPAPSFLRSFRSPTRKSMGPSSTREEGAFRSRLLCEFRRVVHVRVYLPTQHTPGTGAMLAPLVQNWRFRSR